MQEIVTVLVSAHFIADFLLQPNWLQRRKQQAWAVALHAGLVAALSYLFLQQWRVWQIPLLLFAAHGLLDAVKQRCPDTWRSFCVDQAAHLASIILVVLLGKGAGWLAEFDGTGLKWMVLLGGFALCVPGAGFLVGRVAATLQDENELAGKINGLENGGKLIGQLERALIFLFIMIGQPSGIGFLVAAKSILRFGEAKDDQQLAEYVLIGTLLSFGLAIAAAALTQTVLGEG